MNGFFRLIMHFDFMESAGLSATIEHGKNCGLEFDPMQTAFYLSRAAVVPAPGNGMALWRENPFAATARNARTAAEYCNIPADCAVELGIKIES